MPPPREYPPMTTGPAHPLLYLVGQLTDGGYERQLWYLLDALDRARFRPGVIVWDRRPDEPYRARIAALDIPIYDLTAHSRLRRTLELRRLIRTLHPEVLHAWSFYTAPLATAALLGRPGLLVANIRSDYNVECRRVGRLALPLAVRGPRALIANSQPACEAMSAARWPRPRTIRYLPNAIRVADFPHREPTRGSTFEILGVGRLSTEKNWELALRALATLRTRSPRPWRLRFAGTGPCAPALRKMAQSLHIANHVEFLGFRDDVPELLASTHVAILTSRYEGSPNAVLEAMAAARPVIATRVGDVPTLIEDGHTGWITPPEDAQTLAARLLQMMDDPDRAAEMGRQARERVSTEHSPTAIANRLLQIYTELGWAPPPTEPRLHYEADVGCD